MNEPDFTMYIRGHLYGISGFIERGDRSVGIFGEWYIVDSLISMEEGYDPWALLEDLTDSEQCDISDTALIYRDGPRCKEYYWREFEEGY